MKKIILIIFITTGLLAFQSCESYLEEEMVSDVSGTQYLTNYSGISDALDGAYSYLKNYYYGQECGLSLTMYGTDVYTNGSDGWYKSLSQYYFDTSASYVRNLWNNLYAAINQCNGVIAQIGKVTDAEESEIAEVKAEARFLRALYYFIAVQQWGDVHFTLEETVGVELDANKTAKKTIYDEGIIPDLEFAISVLPETQSEYGRATKGAAQFLLSKVYLRYGWDNNDSDAFENAVSYADAVIESGTYTLLDNYGDLFDIDNQENEEVIWSVQNTTNTLDNGNGNTAHILFQMEYDKLPGMQRSIEYGRPWKRYCPTEYLLSLWDRQYDARYHNGFQHVWTANNSSSLLTNQSVGDTAIFIPGVNVGEVFYVADEDGNRVERTLSEAYYNERQGTSMSIYTPDDYTLKIYPNTLKFLDPDRTDKNQTAGTRDWVVMRFAEAYLIAAEAHYKLEEYDEAAAMLNVVRERAAWPGYETQMDVTAGEVDLDLILEERARELFGENERFYDLTRTGTLVERVKSYCNAINYTNYAANNISEKHYLRPIPQDHIDKCENGYEQNEGW